MEALDGNSIAGDLHEVFGREMTSATGICTECRTAARLAELSVYPRAPGTVVRCRGCESVGMVLVKIGGQIHFHVAGFRLDEQEIS